MRQRLAILIFSLPLLLSGAAIRRDPNFLVNSLVRNDDGGTGPINLGFLINLFGVSTGQAFINNNGNLTLGEVYSAFTPVPLNSLGQLIIAPFWADVDTRNLGSNVVTFGASTVNGNAAYGINWIDVGYFNASADLLNSFQLVLISRTDTCPVGVPDCGNFDMEFNYDGVAWETGSFSSSGGVNGLGGFSARVGYTNGTPANTYELPGSAVNGALLDGGPNALISGSFNSSVAGRYVFQVRNNTVGAPGSSPALPVLPSQVIADPSVPGGFRYVFNNVQSGNWFDPPGTYGFDYLGLSGTLFSSAILPTGFSPFTIQYGAGFANTLGTFNGGTIIDFVSLLGSGIGAFRVTGINPTVNSDNPNAFPTFLNFVGTSGSFEMTPLFNDVPEPSALLLTITPLAWVAWRRRNRA
jgi:hypothetical protein